jgi:transcriptional regulator with XRE-family HTH domain
MSIGKNIAYLREVYEISQRELARQIGMSKSVLNRIEQDERELRAVELAKIADYFDISTDAILGRKEINNILFTQRNVLQRDTELVRKYHAAPERIQQVVDTALGVGANEPKPSEKEESA